MTQIISFNKNIDMIRIAEELAERNNWKFLKKSNISRIILTPSLIIPTPAIMNVPVLLIRFLLLRETAIGIHDAIGHDQSDKLKVFIYNLFCRIFATQLLFFSEFSKLEYKRIFWRKRNMKVNYFGLNYDKIFDINTNAPRSKIYDYILFGRMKEYTGINDLEKFASDNPKIRFLVVGANAPPGLDKYGNVTVIRRFVSDDELINLILGAHNVLLPYHSATQSGAIPLAIFCGVGVAFNDVGALKEQILVDTASVEFQSGESFYDFLLPAKSISYEEWKAAAGEPESDW